MEGFLQQLFDEKWWVIIVTADRDMDDPLAHFDYAVPAMLDNTSYWIIYCPDEFKAIDFVANMKNFGREVFDYGLAEDFYRSFASIHHVAIGGEEGN